MADSAEAASSPPSGNPSDHPSEPGADPPAIVPPAIPDTRADQARGLAPRTPYPPLPSSLDLAAFQERGYRILAVIAEGGMGVVYKAVQVRFPRIVALKMMKPDADEELRRRFEREIEALVQLRHPNIIEIYDREKVNNQPYYVMPFMDGGDLVQWTDRPWAPHRAAELIKTLAQAMHAAHRVNVIHRDLKPLNVLWATKTPASDGVPTHPDRLHENDWTLWLQNAKIADFGLAKSMDSQHTPLTEPDQVLGTRAYMSPEQREGGEVGPLTDVYALGVILYELLSESATFKAEFWQKRGVRRAYEAPPALPVQVPVELQGICLRSLRKFPEERPASADHLAKELEAWLRHKPAPDLHTSNEVWLTVTLDQAGRRLEEIKAILRTQRGAAPRVAGADEPIRLEPSRLCLQAYLEALHNLHWRFLTTTFIWSGFWTHDTIDLKVRQANQKMLERLNKRKQEGAEVRAQRLFLLSQHPELEAKAYEHRLMQLQRAGKEKIQEEIDKLARLESNIKQLIRDGFQVKIVYDEDGLYAKLAKVMAFGPDDGEIAIYDDCRLDIFGGGRVGLITDVTIYSGFIADFKFILDLVLDCFNSLWAQGTDLEEYIKVLKQAELHAIRRIDYVPHWLARYEYGLEKSDQKVKAEELECVKRFLRESGRWGKVKRYLDVGTCTARYPRALRAAVVPEGEIIGMDDDPDCVDFARGLVTKLPKSGSQAPARIQIESADFCAPSYRQDEKFDLITCMLGTLSHFGWDRNNKGSESLRRAVHRFAELLAPEGLLVIGNWSEYARTGPEMLRIYEPRDRERLAEWTPSLRELKDLLGRAGLSSVAPERQPDRRLDLCFYAHRNAASAKPVRQPRGAPRR